MNIPESIGAAKTNITNFLIAHGAALPEQASARLIEAQSEPSPVDMIMSTLEALYADRDTIDDHARMLVAELAAFVWPIGWHGIQQDNRGLRIKDAMLRDMGEAPPEGATWPDPDDDPATAPRFVEVASPGPSGISLGGA